jgi:hypothetical protein
VCTNVLTYCHNRTATLVRSPMHCHICTVTIVLSCYHHRTVSLCKYLTERRHYNGDSTLLTIRQFDVDSTTLRWWRYDGMMAKNDSKITIVALCFAIVLSYCHYRTGTIVHSWLTLYVLIETRWPSQLISNDETWMPILIAVLNYYRF